MSLRKNMSRLAMNFIEKKVTVKTIPDETRPRTYEGTIIGVAFRRSENAIVFLTDQVGFAEFAAYPAQGRNNPWYSIKYGSGDKLVDMIEIPLIDQIPINQLLGQYLEKGVE